MLEKPNIAYILVLSDKTAFFKLKDVFPECFLYREKSPRVKALVCLKEDLACHCGHRCIDVLVHRVTALFDMLPKTISLILLYFKNDHMERIEAGVFWRDFREPRVITVNPSAWKYCKGRGDVLTFHPTDKFYLFEPEKKVEVF